MFEWLPELTGSINGADLLAAVGALVFGYLAHEALHASFMKAFGIPYTARLFPDDDTSRWRQLLFGTTIELEMQTLPPRKFVVMVALAPLLQAALPLTLWVHALTYPALDAGTALILVAWFGAAFPSPKDWATALSYQPEPDAGTEVTTHG